MRNETNVALFSKESLLCIVRSWFLLGLSFNSTPLYITRVFPRLTLVHFGILPDV